MPYWESTPGSNEPWIVQERGSESEALLHADGEIPKSLARPLVLRVGVLHEVRAQRAGLGERQIVGRMGRHEVQSETPVDVHGNPGRDIKIMATGGKGTFRCKLILVGSRLYQIIVASPSSDADSSDVKRFLGSFSLK